MKHLSVCAILTTALVLAVAPAARAQGANSCADAQPISGSGPFSYDTTSATTDGHQEGMWSIPGLDDIVKDVWFRWVAPETAVGSPESNSRLSL